MIRTLFAVIAILAAATAPVLASTKRIAVIVGNNQGNAGRPQLHYADADAAKFAHVLVELGGVAPADLFLLEDQSAAALSKTFEQVRQRVLGFHKDPGVRVVIVFYFSGHSDGVALELGRDRVTFSELRRWLASAGADVRIALVDSCKSGALLATKGGKPSAGFQIRMTDELASTGEVLLTSSAADEIALESSEIGGSFFTHHFVSGLRGAADISGDGLVTLTEAYQYAYARTVKTTGETIVGVQHPAYDYRLSGQGELVLAELSKRSGTLQLPSGFDRIVVIDVAHAQVIAEITAGSRATIAVPPGRYEIRASRSDAMFAGAVTVEHGPRVVSSNELAPALLAGSTIRKGTAPDAGPAIDRAPGSSYTSHVVPLILGASALGLLGGGLGLELRAEGRYDAAKSEMTNGPRRNSLYSSANTNRYIAEALAASGLAAAGAAVWLYLRDGSHRPDATIDARVHVVPTASGLAVAGRF
jgi:caspase domain-containing protein